MLPSDGTISFEYVNPDFTSRMNRKVMLAVAKVGKAATVKSFGT
jgi:hypothetical protein